MNSAPKTIAVRGARQHNLRDISLSFPRDALTVITGLSGSGKSSLAFDTIYAEGQRRFVESLSSYARQFLEQMQKPDVDQIEGLPPTVAIEQRGGISNPRSTVATTTEINDYLRALFARVGIPHCWRCGAELASASVSTIVETLLQDAAGDTLVILAPVVLAQRGRHAEVLQRLRKEGLVRVRINGEIQRLDDEPELPARKENTIEAVVDRLKIAAAARARLADSVELAVMLSDGMVGVLRSGDSSEPQLFSVQPMCLNHPQVRVPELTPRLFSFNSPFGACPDCDGLGTVLEFDEELLVADPNRSLGQGAIDAWSQGSKKLNSAYHRTIKDFCEQFKVPINAPYRNLDEQIRRILMHGSTRKDQAAFGATFEGVIPNLRRRWESSDSETVKQKLHGYLSEASCQSCRGARLRREARAVQVGGKGIDEVLRLDIGSALRWLNELTFSGEQATIAAPLVSAMAARLQFMNEVGIGYLTLNRGSATLSGGEAQRIRLATQVGTGMVGVCYILDEPTIGLHARDSARLVATLQRLRDIGNSVVVVEHDEETIAAADHIIDMGPGAGVHGGQVISSGSLDRILKDKKSITGQYLSRRRQIPVPEVRRGFDPNQVLEIRGAREHNLKDINARFPLGLFVCVTGVSGSGKSTLVNRILVRALRRRLYAARERPGEFERLVGGQHIDKVIEIDQTPIGRSPRSNPATYVGAFDLIRRLYAKTREAKIRGYKPSRFSFNIKGGRCEECQGQGTKRIEMHFLPDIYVTCDACKGTRYNRETLEVRYRGKHIAEVLDMPVEEARRFFDSFAKIRQLLQSLSDVGMGYITLGQASTTLSGGEAQRIKLAAELGKSPGEHTLYILDEPTTGLHFADIHNLLNVLNRLVDQGNTVVVIEHNLDVIKVADWIIDLGPEGGAEGGRIMIAGTPEEVMGRDDSYTGRFLKQRLNGQAQRRKRSRAAS